MTSHAELDRLVSELAPIKDEDVRGRADSLQARELFAAIVAAPARPRRLRIALVVASGAAALVAASVGLVLGGSHGTATASAATVLKRASAAARAHALPVAPPGQFVYTKTDSVALDTYVGNGTSYSALIPWSRESWIGATRGRMRQVPGNRGSSPIGTERHGSPQVGRRSRGRRLVSQRRSRPRSRSTCPPIRTLSSGSCSGKP